MSQSIIPFKKEQFQKFIDNLTILDLVRDPEDKSNFPLDFMLIYKDQYKLNFEYLHSADSEVLEFYIIDGPNNDEIEKEIEARIKTLMITAR